MKALKIFFFAPMLVLLLSTEVNAQDILNDTIRWKATGLTDMLSDTTIQKPCEFITYKDKIDWIQKTLVYSVTIDSVEGTWLDINQAGTVKYSVALGGLTGSITFTRTAASVKILVDLHGGSTDIKNEYSISGFEIL